MTELTIHGAQTLSIEQNQRDTYNHTTLEIRDANGVLIHAVGIFSDADRPLDIVTIEPKG